MNGRYLRPLGPLDSKDNDALVVEVGEGETGIAKEKVFSIRRAFLRIFLPKWYSRQGS